MPKFQFDAIVEKTPRYKAEAYIFVMVTLDRVVRSLDKPRHVSGRELLSGLRAEAQRQFGPMACTVLQHWGIENSLDFGHIVFDMVENNVLFKSEEDRLEDFNDPDFFEKIFDENSAYRLIEE